MSFKKIFIILIVFYTSILFSQNTYNIKLVTNANYNKCSSCINLLNNKPQEINFGIEVDVDNNILLLSNSAEWFFNLIKKKKDGIALDIVLKSDFDCSSIPNFNFESVSLGYLMKPIYKKELQKKSIISKYDELMINLGKLPEQFIGQEYEINMLILQDSYLCNYHTVINIPSYKWNLLDMGLYTDTITYKTNTGTNSSNNKDIRTYSKKMKFTIPFEKDKITYSSEDIKPLYDSLNISDFIIKRISIRAYSSVEGDKEYNLKLQKGRAESIVKALQTFQPEQIGRNITTSENWMEFYQSIKGTEFESLSELTKQQIKEKLNNKTYAQKLESILSRQRKAVIEINFEKRYNIENFTAEELKIEFAKSINKPDLEMANKIQKYAFSKIINNKLPTNFISELEIPDKKEFGTLLNSNSVYKYFLDETDLIETYRYTQTK